MWVAMEIDLMKASTDETVVVIIDETPKPEQSWSHGETSRDMSHWQRIGIETLPTFIAVGGLYSEFLLKRGSYRFYHWYVMTEFINGRANFDSLAF